MENQILTRVKPAFLFLLLVSFSYTVSFFIADQLQGPFWIDEARFWETSQQFSQRLIPTLDQIRNYNELNTPLPFIIYGMLGYWVENDLFAGRLLSLILSIVISGLIGWPGKGKNFRPLLALVGLFLFPYFLWLSTRYYTDIIAAFFTLLGVIFYLRQRAVASGLLFILAISSRQYMVAFPVAIAAYELGLALRFRRRPSLSFFLPCIAALSIVGWFLLFGGLAPSSAMAVRPAPDVQRSLWALTPGGGIFFLASLGLAYVIPEFLLFYRRLNWQIFLTRKYLIIAAILLACLIVFPPSLEAKGLLWRVSELLPFYWTKQLVFYGLALLACWRFSRLNLAFWMVLFNTLIMMKAFPWDRYTLPLLVVLWYLQAKGALEPPEAIPAAKLLPAEDTVEPAR